MFVPLFGLLPRRGGARHWTVASAAHVFTYALSCGNIPDAPLPADLSARLSKGFAYEQIDILDFNSFRDVVMHFLPEVVFHLGTGHRYSPMQHIVATNTVGTMNVVEALAAVHGVKPRLVLTSSGGVYGRLGPEQLPVNELARCEPCDIYSFSKFSSERLARLAGGQYAISVFVARVFNVCGPGQDDTHVVVCVSPWSCCPVNQFFQTDLSAARYDRC